MEGNIKGSVDSMITATFILQLPGQMTPLTRSISVSNENYLEAVDVLVFKQNTDDNEYLACKVAAKALDNNNTTSKKFTISLQKVTNYIASSLLQMRTIK